VQTELFRNMPRFAEVLVCTRVRGSQLLNPRPAHQASCVSPLIAKTAEEGAQTSFFCSVSPKAAPGCYHRDCRPHRPTKYALDARDAQRLW
jgi:hypothetical protein